ncbi:hypothetical protein EG329_002419 [Mollisiaceae sp. DMI_Dod_QoI]|nr:hypothetical protein EG329_002419 [Helotiales sp. DMI_Dod_QoI]
MWLINTSSFALEFVSDAEVCEYAILSHTWGQDEISFKDMADVGLARTKPGFQKLEKTCELARSRGLQYAWVDTCCIDKSSSAELTEAINSMFQWYKTAEACFVYLSDYDDQFESESGISGCRWFTRGWTLQELIASQKIEFYDKWWKLLGNKESFLSRLSNITEIEYEVLKDCEKVKTIPIGRRMSWAASRTTTRMEDMAYCLFGIFDVNLPLIYGEGRKAFIRLQEAIARESTDISLFAWESTGSYGAFAQSPADFITCSDIFCVGYATAPSVEYTLTNKGLHMKTLLYLKNDEYILMLPCARFATVDKGLALRLARTSNGYVRLGLTQEAISFVSSLQPLLEMPVYIPKIIGLMEFETTKEELQHRFHVEVS